MKKLLNSTCRDNVIALGQQEIAVGSMPAENRTVVLRDERGVPTAWRVFGFGPFRITRDALTLDGEFLPEHAAAIMDYYREKGTRIPIDSEHFLFRLAEKLGKTETEALATIPGGKAAMGYGTLEQQADGLWIKDIEWVPFAYELMAEGIYRWFSPVIRGLSDGRYRITSIAMQNVPAVDNQTDVMAAGAESGDQGGKVPLYAVTGVVSPNQKGAAVKKLLAVLGAIVGSDVLALGADGEATPDLLGKLEILKTELPKLRADSALAKQVRDALALGAESEPAAVAGKLQALLVTSEAHGALKARVDAMELAAETDKRAKLIEQGKAQGKLTPDMIEKWAKNQDSVALAAFLDAAPVIVAPGTRIDAARLTQDGAVTVTAAQANVFSLLGITDPDKQKAAARL